MKCWICDYGKAKRRYSKCGDRLYVEPLCDTCTSGLIKEGFDLVLEPNNVAFHASQNPRWPNYPILKGLVNQ